MPQAEDMPVENMLEDCKSWRLGNIGDSRHRIYVGVERSWKDTSAEGIVPVHGVVAASVEPGHTYLSSIMRRVRLGLHLNRDMQLGPFGTEHPSPGIKNIRPALVHRGAAIQAQPSKGARDA